MFVMRLILSLIRPQHYGPYEFRTNDIEIALDYAAKCIHVNIWLAAAAREELSRFREFMTWLRMGKNSWAIAARSSS